MQSIIGIESVLAKEAWRFNRRGVEILGQLFGQLSPYRHRVFSIGDLAKLADESECLLAVDLSQNGHIVGTARLVVKFGSNGRYGVLHDMVVDTAYRGRGIGKTLTQRVIEIARRERLCSVELTSKPARVEANQMYLALGFELVTPANPDVEGGENHYRLTL